MSLTVTARIDLQQTSPTISAQFPARFIPLCILAANASASPQGSDMLLTVEGADGSLYVDGEDVTEFDLNSPEKERCLFSQSAGFQSAVQTAPPVVTIVNPAEQPLTLELIVEVIEVGTELHDGPHNAGDGIAPPIP